MDAINESALLENENQTEADSEYLGACAETNHFKNKNSLSHVNHFLSVGFTSESDRITSGTERSRYDDWLSILLLRIILLGGPFKPGSPRANKLEMKAQEIWGIENFDGYLEIHGPVHTFRALKDLLQTWEAEFAEPMVLPNHVVNNLASLQQLLELNQVDVAILAFATLLHGEYLVDEFCELLGNSLSAHQVPRLISRIMNLDLASVEAALADDSVLAISQLVVLDSVGEGNLRNRIDLVSRSFGKRMFSQHDHALDIVKLVIKPVKATTLNQNNFQHIENYLETFAAYLKHASDTKMRGANVLLYGNPGTGKSEFARFLGKHIGCKTYEVGVSFGPGYAITPSDRFKYFQLGQSLLSRCDALMVFDECEEALSSSLVRYYAGSEDTMGQKSWLNALLESNSTPTIWVANSLEDIDPAVIRRFDLVLDMPLPPQSQRKQMLSTLSGGLISEKLIHQIDSSNGSTPAMVAQTARILNVVAQGKNSVETDLLACTLVNNRLNAQGLRQIGGVQGSYQTLAFEPSLINTSVNLQELQTNLRLTSQARLCVYGPPGTGKTAFGKWLADALDRPGHFYKASDLLAPHVGETERLIAKAFDRARTEDAVLQIDEVDSFLQKRDQARQSWEISLVNEMLTQLERFDGFFVASTNRFEHLDSAVLRRFDLNLKFDYLDKASACALFTRSCEIMNLTLDDANVLEQLKSLSQLTPGDFEQVIRQSTFRKVPTAVDLLCRLKLAVSQKPRDAGRAMGFLH